MAAATDGQRSPIWQRLSVRHLLLLTPWIGVVIGASRPIRDNSFLWHVRAGDLQLASGRVLTTDPFSLTMAGEPWRTQSWLADLLYGSLEQATGGLAWVPWLLVACGASVLGLVGWLTFRRVSDPLPVALALVALMWLGLPNLVPRPVLFSLVLLALLMVVLEVQLDWPLPLILWVWAGFHGSFVLGLGLLLLDALRRRMAWQKAAGRIGVALIAVSLTAHGLGVWSMLGSFLTNRGALDFISEWAAPDLLSVAVAPYVLVMVAVLVAAASGRIEARELWVVAPLLVFGLTSARAIMPAAIVLVPFAASVWRPAADSRMLARGPARANLVIATLLIALPFIALVGFPGLDTDRFPIEAATYLDTEKVWHDDATGGYLIYLNQLPVFIDDRAELYGAEFFGEFVNTRRGTPVWRRAFDAYDIQQALVAADAGLAEVLTAEGWHVDFSDESWTVFSRARAIGRRFLCTRRRGSFLAEAGTTVVRPPNVPASLVSGRVNCVPSSVTAPRGAAGNGRGRSALEGLSVAAPVRKSAQREWGTL